MLKIKRITLSGFRGIFTKQELNLIQSGSKSTSLAVYGLNSSGKTSFVDGLEWFLSPANEIEWLKREDAGGHAYPHQEAKDDETFVEIDFSETNIGTLRKTYNPRRITKPTLSSNAKFEELYKSFTIRPYLRYLEIIDFVFNRTGVEKYQKLANWMGFEQELAFQEKIALGIIPQLRKEEEKFVTQKEYIEEEIKRLVVNNKIEDDVLIAYCNDLLKQIGANSIKSLNDLPVTISEIDKKRSNTDISKVATITKAQTFLQTIKFNSDIVSSLKEIEKQIEEFNKTKELADKIEYVNLYEKAYEMLEKQESNEVACPICGTSWKKKNLVSHIKEELALLQEVKQKHEAIIQDVASFKLLINTEAGSVKTISDQADLLNDISIIIKTPSILAYKVCLEKIIQSLGKSIFEEDVKSKETEDTQKNAIAELEVITKDLEAYKQKLQLSKTEILINEANEKIKLLNTKLEQRTEIVDKMQHYSSEILKFTGISDELFRLVQEDITKRFKDISSLIEKYFKILRQDKDIKGIEIALNLEKARAAGRSAEIQLSYYDLVVKPAYKVLSESLLNSLGLAVYFTCVKQFNPGSKFIVLDDVMNSLDVGHRDTLLDLIEQEFSDYQIVLFTHDLHWFERIQKRFPSWLHKKIKNWSYETGPKIDRSNTSLEDIKELLEDSTKAHEAGRSLGVYVESLLNELCEQLHVEVRYRYTKHDPPTLEELFVALHKRLKDKLLNNPVVGLVQNAQKYEPIIRNATSHARQNYASTISPDEIKRAMAEWLKAESALWCSKCNKFAEYKRDRDQIECRCGALKLDRVS